MDLKLYDNLSAGGKKCDPYSGDRAGLAGIMGETEAFYGALGVIKRLYIDVFNNKVIPNVGAGGKISDSGGGVECDLICAGSRRIYVFEVKHLSGALSVAADGSWILRQNGGRREKSLSNGFSQAVRCRRALVEYLSAMTGVPAAVVECAVESRVLFTCDNFDDSMITGRKGEYIILKNLESYLYFSELKGAQAEHIDEYRRSIAAVRGMCVVSVNGAGGAPASILRGDIAGPVFCRRIYIKGGAVDYYNTFCRAESALDLAGVSHIIIKGVTVSGEMLARVNYSSGGPPAFDALVVSPALVFKPRGFETVNVDFANISQIAFC
ncbi:MAG TPA: nuclease-related domain-containing protein [Candidatus Wallbacteria bacterium]|nr:nuclease-related domain-containing protein [Candidatus Wallbacteria bacterium]